MAELLKKGTPVSWKPTVSEGVVESAAMSEDGTVRYLVGFFGVDGERHQRWFDAAELQAKGGGQ